MHIPSSPLPLQWRAAMDQDDIGATFNWEVSRDYEWNYIWAYSLFDPYLFHILPCVFSPSVVRSWQVLRLLFVWEAYWRNSSSEDPVIWMVPFFLVALAIIVFIYYLMCNPLVRPSKYLLSKGMNTGGSASLSASYLPFLLLLILLFSTHVTFSLISHSHFPEGEVSESLTNLGCPEGRVLIPTITEIPSFSCMSPSVGFLWLGWRGLF